MTRAQLLATKLSPGAIDRRLRSGYLLRVHAGVYRVGHDAPSTEAVYIAAVLTCDGGAVLSGRAAGHTLGLLKGRPPPAEVTAPTRRRVRRLQTRYSRRRLDRVVVRGIPVTTAPRTLVDLAAVLSEYELGRACHEAGVKYDTTPAEVDAVLAGCPNARGAATLRRVLSGEARIALSKLERRVLRLVRQGGLPLPRTNKPAGGRRVDCRWAEQGLTVEIDSYRYHRSRHAWEQDRRRERQARARGDDFRRFTHDDVLDRPHQFVRELRAALSGHHG